jgi:HD superfamily phosphohydrolase YqeK
MAQMAALQRAGTNTSRPWGRITALLEAMGITREAPPAPVVYTRAIVGFVGGLAALSLIIVAAAVRAPGDVGGFAFMTIAVVTLASTSVRLITGSGTIFSASSFAQLGLAVAFGPSGCLAGALAEQAAVAVRYRIGVFRLVFNVAAIFLSNLAAWGVYTEAVRLPGPTWLKLAVAGVAAGGAHNLVNNCGVAIVVSLATGRRFERVLLASLRMLGFSVLYGYAAVGFATFHNQVGAQAFAYGMAPIAAFQVFLVIYARALRQHEDARTQHVHRIEQAGISLQRSYAETLVALTSALDARDQETEGHSRRVVEYTRLLAVRLGLGEHDLAMISQGALLHDIGKIGVPDAILHKPGPLTEEEWEVMRRHPQIGLHMVSGIEHLREARTIILHHHERFDGKGYPLGLRGEAITLGARIFSVADTLDAITQDRPYRAARSFDQAREEILRHRGTQFDPDVVDVFLTLNLPAMEEIASHRHGAGRDLLERAGTAAPSTNGSGVSRAA